MRLSIKAENDIIKKTQKQLAFLSKNAPSALASSLNRAATNVNSNVGKEVRKNYTVKSADIKATLRKTKATKSRLRADIISSGSTLPLDKFKVSPKTENPNRRKPIKVSIKKGTPKAVLGAFVANLNGVKVFQRSGKARLPIKRLHGLSVPQMVGKEETRANLEKEGQAMFIKRVDHEVKRLLEKRG